jgi:hypothetical protein
MDDGKTLYFLNEDSLLTGTPALRPQVKEF